jgi:hypothetical protein
MSETDSSLKNKRIDRKTKEKIRNFVTDVIERVVMPSIEMRVSELKPSSSGRVILGGMDVDRVRILFSHANMFTNEYPRSELDPTLLKGYKPVRPDTRLAKYKEMLKKYKYQAHQYRSLKKKTPTIAK